jgi:hypothetical protein
LFFISYVNDIAYERFMCTWFTVTNGVMVSIECSDKVLVLETTFYVLSLFHCSCHILISM